MKVLIVEDEIKTGDYLRQGLNEAGYNTDLARTGIDGLHLALTGGYELLILDVMLPGLDGWQLLETVRRGGSQMPVLFLTARDQVEDRVRGSSSAPTTIWSSPSPLPNCWPASEPCSGEAAPAPSRRCSARPICNSICCVAG